MPAKTNTKQFSQQENIHRRSQWIDRFFAKREHKFSKYNQELLYTLNDDMIINSMADTTRYKNLTQYGKLTNWLNKDWKDVTEADLRKLVAKIMEKHSENGKETGYTAGLKVALKWIVRFVKLGTRKKPRDSEVDIIKFIQPKKPQDHLTREDLPTDEELNKLIQACANSSRDKAMLSVHAEAGTRIGELLNLKIKDFRLDNNGGWINVIKGKTGSRPIRIVKSVPYLVRWLNDHPFKDDHEKPMWVYLDLVTTFGQPINYAGFNNILHKRVKQAGISKRITSHLFRHKEITDLAPKLSESESRMRHGWERTSLMPSRYTHLNQDDLDDKMLKVMGVKKEDKQEDELKECAFCKIKYANEVRFCDNCSRPLDVADAIIMEKENEAKQKALVLELLRQERAKQARERKQNSKDKTIDEQQKQIDELKALVDKLSNS